jgi:hypothetical protein
MGKRSTAVLSRLAAAALAWALALQFAPLSPAARQAVQLVRGGGGIGTALPPECSQLTASLACRAAAALGAPFLWLLRSSLHRLEHAHLPRLPRGRRGAAEGAQPRRSSGPERDSRAAALQQLAAAALRELQCARDTS